jgi:hypothetical protein
MSADPHKQQIPPLRCASVGMTHHVGELRDRTPGRKKQVGRKSMTDVIVDPDKFVTVGKFLEPANAQMAKGMLESAGIECFLQGENANSLLALAFRARLLVHKQDEEAARQLLGSAGDELTEEERNELEEGDDQG